MPSLTEIGKPRSFSEEAYEFVILLQVPCQPFFKCF